MATEDRVREVLAVAARSSAAVADWLQQHPTESEQIARKLAERYPHDATAELGQEARRRVELCRQFGADFALPLIGVAS